jgi:hypothetical protein
LTASRPVCEEKQQAVVREWAATAAAAKLEARSSAHLADALALYNTQCVVVNGRRSVLNCETWGQGCFSRTFGYVTVANPPLRFGQK